MRRSAIIVLPLAALGLVIAYHFVPFLLEAGGPAFLARSRLFLPSASLLLTTLSFYRLWRTGPHTRPDALTAVILRFSASALLAFLLFPQTIANILADAFKGAM